MPKKFTLFLTLLLLLCLLISLLYLKTGITSVTFTELFSILNNPKHSQYFVVTNFRLPRMLLTWVIGPLLSISGAILQTISKNPLASPDILGINASASLLAIITIVYIPFAPSWLITISSFLGGMGCFLIIYMISKTKNLNATGLTLIGVALHILFSSLNQGIISLNSLQIHTALSWLSGSLWAKEMQHFYMSTPLMLIVFLLVLFLAPRINLHSFSDEVALSLGENLARSAGPIGFIALLAPTLARILVGQDILKVVPISSLIAIFWLISADLLGKMILSPLEIPVGIVTSLIGVPCFFLILYRQGQIKGTNN
jgi:iron complex transport system permease protein